jgi:hypothetical protein
VKSSLASEDEIVVASTTSRATSANFRIDEVLRVHSDRVALALAIFAAVRVFLFAAAFPLSNNTDEKFHYLTIQMYAQGHFPGKDLPSMDPGFARKFLLYWSPEYGLSQSQMDQDGIRTPPFRLAAQDQNLLMNRGYYAEKLRTWVDRRNYEAQAAPFYYLVAACWYKVGATLGIRDWALAYWVRFLNPIVYGFLVWVSYKFVRKVYPDQTFLCLAVPALISVFPQDVFFGMNRDVLSPLICAVALILMVDAIAEESVNDRSLLLGSLLAGLAFLTEVSNVVLYGALFGILWVWLHGSSATRLRKFGFVWLCLVFASALPAIWMYRNHIVMGDLTGSRAKMRHFGWTVRPVAEILHHPLFSWHGLSYFFLMLIKKFWRGEYVWHNLPMRSAAADWFYIATSVLMVISFVLAYALQQKTLSGLQKWVGLGAALLVAGFVLFLAAISIPFDFHEFDYPSRAYPYFVSGRIISGALLPFVLIYAIGLKEILKYFRKWVSPWSAIVTVMLGITVCEFLVRKAVFASPYNFFALVSHAMHG